MDYWHEIVESYDDPKNNGIRGKDHGTFSRKTSAMLLIYLALGTDYSTGIAKYFCELDSEKPENHRPSVLTNASKISSMLKRMNEDKLVILSKKVSVGAAPRSYYALNPRILQSPIRDSTIYIKRNGSPFTIPLETIEGFLGWLALNQAGTTDKMQKEQLRQKRHEQADEIFESLFDSHRVNYYDFLFFIKAEARRRDLQSVTNDQQPALNNLVLDYIKLTHGKQETSNLPQDKITLIPAHRIRVHGRSMAFSHETK
jgi:hypothetical protein